MTTDLAERYGTHRRWQRPVTIVLAGLLAVVALIWLAWTAWFHSTPAAESTLVAFTVDGDHATSATLDVDLVEGAAATCRLRAYAEDHTTVGELAFTPVHGLNEVVIRTERLATTVEALGCTAPGQERPR